MKSLLATEGFISGSFWASHFFQKSSLQGFGIWEGEENLQNLLERSVAPIMIGIGKSNRHGGDTGASFLKELPLGETNKPIKKAQGTGQSD